MAFHNAVNMHADNHPLIEENGSIFPISENEVIKVEELYKCSDLGDDDLDLDISNQRMHYNFGEFLTIEYQPTKNGGCDYIVDAPDSSPNLSDEVTSFCDGMPGATDALFCRGKSNTSDDNEYYLLDSKSVDEDTDFKPKRRSRYGALRLKNHSMVSDSKVNGSEMPEVAAAGTSENEFGKMTIDELHEAFGNRFGCETTMTDKQWLKKHLCFGLQNLLPPNHSQSKMIMPTSNQCSNIGSTSSKDFLKSKMKSRIGPVKRERHDHRVCLKELSSEDENLKATFFEEELLTRKRSRKRTRRFIEESVQKNSRHQEKKCGAPCTYKARRGRPRKGFEAKRIVCPTEPFDGSCIQVPFGEPILSDHAERKVYQCEDLKDNRLLSSNIDTDMDLLSTGSREDTSDDDCDTSKKNTPRRKHHVYWSVSEVLKLVEGVSLYGVGRWSEIKRMMFPSSESRTSVDLKDKWRNLLRSSEGSRKSREIEQKKHRSQLIPQSILHRVKELAAIYPYPRGRKTQVSPTYCIISPPPLANPAHGICLPLSTALKV